MINLVVLFVAPLERGGFRYAITGSVAGSAYGEPRMTNDVDIVVDLAVGDGTRFASCFPASDFYCPPEEVIDVEARRGLRGHFNVIHHDSGFKADIYPKGNDALHDWALAAARRVDVDGQAIALAPPEYVIVRKLEYFREGGSQKHVDDIENIARSLGEKLDGSAVERYAARLSLDVLWREISTRIKTTKT